MAAAAVSRGFAVDAKIPVDRNAHARYNVQNMKEWDGKMLAPFSRKIYTFFALRLLVVTGCFALLLSGFYFLDDHRSPAFFGRMLMVAAALWGALALTLTWNILRPYAAFKRKWKTFSAREQETIHVQYLQSGGRDAMVFADACLVLFNVRMTVCEVGLVRYGDVYDVLYGMPGTPDEGKMIVTERAQPKNRVYKITPCPLCGIEQMEELCQRIFAFREKRAVFSQYAVEAPKAPAPARAGMFFTQPIVMLFVYLGLFIVYLFIFMGVILLPDWLWEIGVRRRQAEFWGALAAVVFVGGGALVYVAFLVTQLVRLIKRGDQIPHTASLMTRFALVIGCFALWLAFVYLTDMDVFGTLAETASAVLTA